MPLSIGIVGLPNVGKSTLFQTLTKKQVNIANYPFCTIEPNVGTVEVPDQRLHKLAQISESQKIVPTVIEFIDIAGLVKGASQGEGLGNKFLDNIRTVDAICEVLRSFEDSDITHVEDRINPGEDAEIIDLELMLADLDQVTKAIVSLEKKIRSNDKNALQIGNVLSQIKEALEQSIPIRDINLSEDDQALIKSFNFLSQKPIMYVINTDDTYSFDLAKFPNLKDKNVLPLSIKVESEISAMELEEQGQYLELLGRTVSGVDLLIQEGYKLLDLISFLTTGKQETKAWTIQNGTKAPQAGGVIHSDIERGFIAVDVIYYQDFVTYNGEVGAKAAAKLRTEGKNYIIQDGDVSHFKFNV